MATEKQKFVRQTSALFIACHPQHPDADRAIIWAEALWKQLQERGYGEKAEPPKSRGVDKDWYNELGTNQQKWFCAFWNAFKLKTGRNEAAQRWHEMGVLSDSQYKTIVAAAEKEAAKDLPPGSIRKMAQGWLSERRWLDHIDDVAPASTEAAERQTQYRKLLGDLTHARQTKNRLPANDAAITFWENEIVRIGKAIEALR